MRGLGEPGRQRTAFAAARTRNTLVRTLGRSVLRRLAAAGRQSRSSPLIRCVPLHLFHFGGRFSWRSAKLCQYRGGYGTGYSSVGRWLFRPWPPDTWQWPRAECIQNNSCGLSHQSPINIETYGVVFDQRMPPLVFSGYEDDLLDFNVTSDGYTVTVEPGPKDPVRTVQGGAMPGVFVFSRIQFHWGSTSSQGSEHRIDGLTYAMESHIIHTNQKYVPAEANYHPDGLAILSTLYRVSDQVTLQHLAYNMYPRDR
ncbi:hypothetical protein ISCGN_006602 [Ixodes scapularis]